jgi:hypothetical protein
MGMSDSMPQMMACMALAGVGGTAMMTGASPPTRAERPPSCGDEG